MSGRTVPHAHPATAEYEFANPSRLGEQRFGEGLLPEEILTPTLYHGYYVRPRASRAGEGSRAGASELRLSEGKFQAFLDVSHFTPDEVTVRTVDNLLEVSARHPQRLDRHGFVSREFCRTYVLPADVDPWRVRAALSHDGILNLEAPRGGRHLDTEVNEVYISLLPAPPDPEEEEEDCETIGPMYEQVLHRPVSQKRSSDSTSEESHLHYADIHVLSQTQPHSGKVNRLHLETATEYAVLRFPKATPRYDCNNGTLV
ncbi:Heat shock protein beta-2 [Cricetulus griseus]|uniref:Heat shock protein beta-2 n=1 Tax=Cricetulus griseus TaxID=10029 RepID=G3H2H3_CRIGR|nr:Heat shock protein beta-2 [Cricetulus griseus]ERE77087.1 heat shock protein beta-2-like protein [Cricetulus griseus]